MVFFSGTPWLYTHALSGVLKWCAAPAKKISKTRDNIDDLSWCCSPVRQLGRRWQMLSALQTAEVCLDSLVVSCKLCRKF